MSAHWLLAGAIVALGAALAVAGIALLLRDRRERRAGRTLQAALAERAAPQAAPADPAPARRWPAVLEAIGRYFGGGRLEAALLAPEDRLLLDQVGWNNRTGAAMFLGLRIALALFALLIALAAFQPGGGSGAVLLLAALAAGVLLPKLGLRAWAARLRRQAAAELPLLIDLLRLLQGVGFSMDQSLQMLGDRLHGALPVLGRELREANAAYVRGRTRAQSLRRLAESFGNEDLRSLTQVIVQVSQHGGAVQEPLRQFGVRLREQRRMGLKEKVGKLSVKMTVVMMLTLLPALMLVLAGPAIIALSAAVGGMG